MSISKAISLIFSDGTNTLYTKSTNVNIPFEVSYIRIANMYLETQGVGGAAMNAVISSNIIDSDILCIGREYTSTKPIKHVYNVPRPINGSYNFSVNLSNTLNDFITTSRIGYIIVGTIDIVGVDDFTITINSPLSTDAVFLGTGSDIIGKHIKLELV